MKKRSSYISHSNPTTYLKVDLWREQMIHGSENQNQNMS